MIHAILGKIKSCNDHTKIIYLSMSINNNRLYTNTTFRLSLNIGFPVKSPILFGDFTKIHTSKYLNFITGASTSKESPRNLLSLTMLRNCSDASSG